MNNEHAEPPPTPLAGKTALVTGATSGIGRATALRLASLGARVLVGCRSAERGKAAVEQIREESGNDQVAYLEMELGDLDSVREAADAVLEREDALNFLVANAGVAGKRGLTPSGFELAFGTNHLGHFLLVTLLLEHLRNSADQKCPSRVVVVASDAHYDANGIDFEAVRRPTRSFTAMREYAVSKLANVLFAQELARRSSRPEDGAPPPIVTASLHPGVIASNIWSRVPWPVRPLIKLFMDSPEQGARTPVHCVVDPAVVEHSGLYWDRCQPRPASAAATPELARELWQRSEEWVN